MRILNKKIWPYQIRIDTQNEGAISEITKWCRDTVGLQFKEWHSYYIPEGKIYAFKDQETLLVFKLKWSNHGTVKIY